MFVSYHTFVPWLITELFLQGECTKYQLYCCDLFLLKKDTDRFLPNLKSKFNWRIKTMTSKSKFRSTLEYGSDMVYDFTCHSCQDEKKNIEANFFCQDCSQCFCDTCVKHHSKILKRHAVLGRKDVDKWSTDTALVGPLVRCDSHPGEIHKLYCGDHRRLCCPVCISVDHK